MSGLAVSSWIQAWSASSTGSCKPRPMAHALDTSLASKAPVQYKPVLTVDAAHASASTVVAVLFAEDKSGIDGQPAYMKENRSRSSKVPVVRTLSSNKLGNKMVGESSNMGSFETLTTYALDTSGCAIVLHQTLKCLGYEGMTKFQISRGQVNGSDTFITTVLIPAHPTREELVAWEVTAEGPTQNLSISAAAFKAINTFCGKHQEELKDTAAALLPFTAPPIPCWEERMRKVLKSRYPEHDPLLGLTTQFVSAAFFFSQDMEEYMQLTQQKEDELQDQVQKLQKHVEYWKDQAQEACVLATTRESLMLELEEINGDYEAQNQHLSTQIGELTAQSQQLTQQLHQSQQQRDQVLHAMNLLVVQNLGMIEEINGLNDQINILELGVPGPQGEPEEDMAEAEVDGPAAPAEEDAQSGMSEADPMGFIPPPVRAPPLPITPAQIVTREEFVTLLHRNLIRAGHIVPRERIALSLASFTDRLVD